MQGTTSNQEHPHKHAIPWKAPAVRSAPQTLANALDSSLRAKTLLIVALTMLSLLVVVSVSLRYFLIGSFATLEAQMMRTNVDRVQNTLAEELNSLESFNLSYSLWDDTYAFAQDHNSAYIQSNLHDQGMVDANLNLYVVFDAAGQLVYGKAFDLGQRREIELPERFRQLAPNDPLLAHRLEPGAINGIVVLPGAPMLVSSHPILTSTGTGPARGTLIMGRFLDAAMVSDLSRRLQLSLDFFPARAGLPADVAEVLPQLNSTAPQLVRPRNDQVVAGYHLIDDLDGRSPLVARVEMSRTIMAQGQASVMSALVSLLLGGVVFGVVTLLLLERFVLARLACLSRRVEAISVRGDLSARLGVGGHDEIAHLADQMDAMLQALQQAQSEQRLLEQQRMQMKLREENIRAKQEFLAVVSHELRTPLTPLRGFIDMFQLDADRLEPDHQMYLEKIHTSAQHLTSLVEDVLEIARVEAHKLELERRPVDVQALVSEAVQLWQPEVERASITLTLDAPDNLPLVCVDSRRMRQVLVNLISNAIKYTYPGGAITLRIAPAQDWVEIQVQDTGVGMTSEQLAQLFTPFYRAENPLSEHVQGTGLGLVIARALVELHGGKLLVCSQPGVGSTFSCVLPRYCPPQ